MKPIKLYTLQLSHSNLRRIMNKEICVEKRIDIEGDHHVWCMIFARGMSVSDFSSDAKGGDTVLPIPLTDEKELTLLGGTIIGFRFGESERNVIIAMKEI